MTEETAGGQWMRRRKTVGGRIIVHYVVNGHSVCPRNARDVIPLDPDLLPWNTQNEGTCKSCAQMARWYEAAKEKRAEALRKAEANPVQ